ncbi:hypothetical protein [Streptomyces angustmyceticus]|uniref:hypothetical protein n=1 Tax=Streptomyces angustmyceticus TaxID=285578 RepID=UPI003D9386DB
MRTDVHAHLWSEDYLRLLESHGRRDAAAHRGLGAGGSPRELDARFAGNDAAFTPLLAELDRRGGVLSLHPSGHDAGSPLIAAHRMRWMVGAPTEDTYQSGQQLRRAVSFIEEALPPERAEQVLTAGARLLSRRQAA